MPESISSPASPRNRRSGRRGKTESLPFPVRTVIILVAVLLLAVLCLAMVNGDMKKLRADRAEAEKAFANKVASCTVRYREWIEKYAAENGVHPAFIAAVILNESSYDPSAESSVGARGLMQVMEDTFEFVSGKLGETATFDDMYDPETNIRYGTWYIAYLSAQFGGDPVEIACAYHAGANNVKLWIMNLSADGETLRLDDIPYENTQNYARKVCNDYSIYFQYYYPDNP